MLKFMVVIYKRPGLSDQDFRRHLQDVRGPLAKKLPGLRKYIQNYVCADPKRKPAGMGCCGRALLRRLVGHEAAWASPQGAASDADLQAFADLTRTTWSAVDEVTVLQ